MKRSVLTIAIAMALTMPACSRHLLFVEEDHIGLRAKFEGESPTPAEVHLGYRRGVVAFIPQQSSASRQVRPDEVGSVTATTTAGKKSIVIKNDPRDLMSLYTIFKANVGFLDPVELHHFLATGAAAESLLANQDELRNLTDNLKSFEKNDEGSAGKEETPAGGAK